LLFASGLRCRLAAAMISALMAFFAFRLYFLSSFSPPPERHYDSRHAIDIFRLALIFFRHAIISRHFAVDITPPLH
jgi:hypothetical protein